MMAVERYEQFSLRRLFKVMTWGIVVWGMLWVVGDCLYGNMFPQPLTALLAIPHWFLFIGTPFIAAGLLIDRFWWGVAIGFVVAVAMLFSPTVLVQLTMANGSFLTMRPRTQNPADASAVSI